MVHYSEFKIAMTDARTRMYKTGTQNNLFILLNLIFIYFWNFPCFTTN